jgi:hypothetical protein
LTALGYDVHGVRVEIRAESPVVRSAIDARLRFFRADGPAPAELRFEIGAGDVHRPDGESRPVYDWPVGEVSWFDASEELYIELPGRARLLASPRAGQVRTWVAPGAGDDAWLFSRPLLTLPLVELLKWRGLYSVHAAGLAIDGRAVLLSGPSGSGKSTLAVALARAGFDYLGDDMVLLTTGHGVRVHALPDEADLSPESGAWFPEIDGLEAPPPDGWPKHRVTVDARIATAVRCAAIVLPAVGRDELSTLRPASSAEALVELAPNVLLTEPAHSQAHLDAVGELARTSAAYRLSTGRDFTAIAERIRDLLRG